MSRRRSSPIITYSNARTRSGAGALNPSEKRTSALDGVLQNRRLSAVGGDFECLADLSHPHAAE